MYEQMNRRQTVIAGVTLAGVIEQRRQLMKYFNPVTSTPASVSGRAAESQ